MIKNEFSIQQQLLARFAKALSHPVRITILQMLARQSCCYHGDMSEVLPIAKSTLSQHLNELKNAGLIQGTFELPLTRYCINKDNWTLCKQMFNELFDALEQRNIE